MTIHQAIYLSVSPLLPHKHNKDHQISAVIGNRITQNKATNRCLVFVKNLIIFTQRNTEDDRRHIFKTMDPFLAFRPLATNIKQPAQQTQSPIYPLSWQDRAQILWKNSWWSKFTSAHYNFYYNTQQSIFDPISQFLTKFAKNAWKLNTICI